MMTLYNMLCFSPFVPDLEAKQKMGYFCCLVVASHLLLNLYLILSTSVYGFKVSLKLWLARRKLSRQRSANQIKIQSRKRTRKLAISNQLFELECSDFEIREQYQLNPNERRKYQLEAIEEE
jgi:biopolymer transport protein ExbB/TolQ